MNKNARIGIYSTLLITFLLIVFTITYSFAAPDPFTIEEYTEYDILTNTVYLNITENAGKVQIINVLSIFNDTELYSKLIYNDIKIKLPSYPITYELGNSSIGKYSKSNTTNYGNGTIILKYYDSSDKEMYCDFVLGDKSCMVYAMVESGNITTYTFQSIPSQKSKAIISGQLVEFKSGDIPLPKYSTIELMYTYNHPLAININKPETKSNKYDIKVLSSDGIDSTTLDPIWFNVSWLYSKVISNMTAGGIINITYNTKMNTDFSDLRFISLDNSTQYYYYIDYYASSKYAIVHVAYNDTMLMYYGNSGASSTSSITNVYNSTTHYYSFESFNGTTATDGTGLNNLTGFKSTTINEGKIFNSFLPNGITPIDTKFGLNSTDSTDHRLSFCVWYNKTGAWADEATLLSNQVAGDNANGMLWIFWCAGCNGWYAYIRDATTSQALQGTFNPSTNAWNQLCFIYNSTQAMFYNNGVLDVKVNANWNPDLWTTRNAYLFSRIATRNMTNIAVDDIRFYNKDLNQTEITQLYQQGVSRYYILDAENSGESADTPQFSTIVTNPTNASLWRATQNYIFNATITNNNGTAGLSFNNINYSMFNQSGNLFNKTLQNLAYGTYPYYFWSFGNGSSKLFNATVTYYYSIINPFPNVTFTNQTPVDISVLNVINNNLYINYSITTNATLNSSTVKLYYKSNDTLSNIQYYQNGSAFSGYFGDTLFLNTSTEYEWRLLDNNIYSGTYNLGSVSVDNTAHSSVTSNINFFIKTQYLNVSNRTRWGIFEIMANSTAGANPSSAYYCNSSYVNDKVSTSTNCVLIGTRNANVSFDHNHLNNSKHDVFPFTVNTTTGKIGSVVVTSTSWFLFGTSDNKWRIYNVPTLTRANMTQTAIDVNSNVWTVQSYSSDQHIRQYYSSDIANSTFYYFACANNTLGDENCSSVRSDLLELAGLPPQAPQVINPSTTASYLLNDTITINWTASSSPNGYLISYYNVSLLNSDGSYNKTLNNTNLGLSYIWTISGTTPGNYIIGIKAIDNQNQTSSYGISENFSLSKATANLVLLINGNSNNVFTTYPYTVNSSMTSNIGMINLTRNGADINSLNNTIQNLSAGSYLFNASIINTTDINYNEIVFNVTINKSTAALSINILPSLIIFNGTSTNVTGIGCPSQLICTLFINGINTTNPDNQTKLPIGVYNYTFANYTGNENYTATYTTSTLTVLLSTFYPEYTNISVLPASGQTYSATTNYLFNVSWSVINSGMLDTAIFSFDNINYTTVNISLNNINLNYTLVGTAIGTYKYYFWANSTTGESNATSEYNYVISAISTSTTIGGSRQNTLVYSNDPEFIKRFGNLTTNLTAKNISTPQLVYKANPVIRDIWRLLNTYKVYIFVLIFAICVIYLFYKLAYGVVKNKKI